MTKQTWISLADYSLKHKVSISTLRRRIKNNELEHQLDDGRYLVQDHPLGVLRRAAEPIAPPQQRKGPAAPLPPPCPQQPNPSPSTSTQQDIQMLINELKKAYATILQQKEEQIVQLKEEISDLKTLTQVLEDENNRLKANLKNNASLDHWLKDI